MRFWRTLLCADCGQAQVYDIGTWTCGNPWCSGNTDD